MKFRGIMTEPSCVRKFYHIFSAISKLSKSCVLRLTEDNMYLIMTEPGNIVGGPTFWAEIDQKNLFNDYKMEGVSQENNEIYLEFSSAQVHKTVTTLRSPSVMDLKIKLAKKADGPCLTFEVRLTGAADVWTCTHDVPVQVLPRKEWVEYASPDHPEVDISITMPADIKMLKRILEKYKMLDSTLTVSCTRDGDLTLKAEADEAKMSTRFPDLRVPRWIDSLPWKLSQDRRLDSASVRVDIKRLIHLFNSEHLVPERTVLNIVDNQLLQIMMVTNELTLIFYLPKTNK
eukprot:TRINITY_DN37275_c0_g1_i1.p1 TRINITY_DN37275_c0_g1~~TRINITY_DN37275_c0_g1_i1.p1  ORF type:complete len:288 (-),score=25.57 TRINITY_DN37275_c0_g1_i1:168-1031(-)